MQDKEFVFNEAYLFFPLSKIVMSTTNTEKTEKKKDVLNSIYTRCCYEERRMSALGNVLSCLEMFIIRN